MRVLEMTICLSIAGIAHLTTRGSDGWLAGLLVFGIPATLYWVAVYRHREWTFFRLLLHFILFQFFSIAAASFESQLDEMAGMLLLLIPLLIFGISAVAFFIKVLQLTRFKCPRGSAFDCIVVEKHRQN